MAASSRVAISTRLQTKIFLIGQPEPNLPDKVLPLTSDVLKTFFYHLNSTKKSVPESLKITVDELIIIWNKARIPTAFHPNVVLKLKTLVQEFKLIKKNKSRLSDSQKSREKSFTDTIGLLFDIAHKDAETMIRIEEDKEFLLDQRCQRKMVMFGEDKELSKLEERNEARKQAERERKLKEEQRQSGASAIVPVIEPLHDESYSDDNDNDAVDNDKMVDRDFEIEIPVYYRQQVSKASSSGSAESSLASTPKRQCILDTILDSPDVSSTLDRINLSDTKFTILAAAIARAGG